MPSVEEENMDDLRRRQLLLAVLFLPIAARGQESTRPYRIGLLTTEPLNPLRQSPLQRSLAELGYVEGRNMVIERRDSEGRIERLDALAADLVRLKVDVILAANPPAVMSAKRATTTIPIVMMHTPDPVRLGLIASLAKPGGNITGVTTLSADVSIKQLELFGEAVPRLIRVALIWNPDNPWHDATVRVLERDAGPMGLQLQPSEVRGPAGFDGAFRAMLARGTQGVLVLADPMTYFHRRQLAGLAIRHRLPMMGSLSDYAEAGSLLSYWADTNDVYRRVASFVDRILKGANPGDLPVEQPTKFELVVNLKTAKALGITIPRDFLLRADRVIE
jgi:putative ABC transport system substrate-binding protein